LPVDVVKFGGTAVENYKRCFYFNWWRKVFTGFFDAPKKCNMEVENTWLQN